MAMAATIDNRRPTTGRRHSTTDSRLSNVGRRSVVGRRLSNGAGLANFALKWQSAKGRNYSVYATPNLSEGWPETPIAEIDGTGDVLEYVPEQTAAVQFFKVSVRVAD